MGMWTGIKHAINSTLGTADFKPLDKIIEGQRTLAASDSVIQVVLSSTTSIGSNNVVLGSFVPQTEGSVRIITRCSKKSSNINTNATLIVKRVDIDVEVGKITTNLDAMDEYNVQLDVAIKKGVQYEIIMRTNTSGAYVKFLNIGAQIIDTSLVEVI